MNALPQTNQLLLTHLRKEKHNSGGSLPKLAQEEPKADRLTIDQTPASSGVPPSTPSFEFRLPPVEDASRAAPAAPLPPASLPPATPANACSSADETDGGNCGGGGGGGNKCFSEKNFGTSGGAYQRPIGNCTKPVANGQKPAAHHNGRPATRRGE